MSFVTRLSLALAAHGLLGLQINPIQPYEPGEEEAEVMDPISGKSVSVMAKPGSEGGPEVYTVTRGDVQTRYEVLANLATVVGCVLLLDRATEECKSPLIADTPFLAKALCYLRAMGISGVAVEKAPDLVEGVDVNEAITFRDRLLGTVVHVTRGVVPVRAMRPHPLVVCYTVHRPEPRDGMVRYPVGDSVGFALSTALRSLLDARAYAMEAVEGK